MLRVRAGVAVLGSPALFEARLTLVPAPDQDAVLARCGASSGPASSPAPSGAVTVHVSSGLCCVKSAVNLPCCVLVACGKSPASDRLRIRVTSLPVPQLQKAVGHALQAAAGATPPTKEQMAVKAEAGPEAQPAAAAAAPQQATKAPAQPAVGTDAAAAAPGATPPNVQPPPQRQHHEEWRWRLLSFTVLPSELAPLAMPR